LVAKNLTSKNQPVFHGRKTHTCVNLAGFGVRMEYAKRTFQLQLTTGIYKYLNEE